MPRIDISSHITSKCLRCPHPSSIKKNHTPQAQLVFFHPQKKNKSFSCFFRFSPVNTSTSGSPAVVIGFHIAKQRPSTNGTESQRTRCRAIRYSGFWFRGPWNVGPVGDFLEFNGWEVVSFQLDVRCCCHRFSWWMYCWLSHLPFLLWKELCCFFKLKASSSSEVQKTWINDVSWCPWGQPKHSSSFTCRAKCAKRTNRPRRIVPKVAETLQPNRWQLRKSTQGLQFENWKFKVVPSTKICDGKCLWASCEKNAL